MLRPLDIAVKTRPDPFDMSFEELVEGAKVTNTIGEALRGEDMQGSSEYNRIYLNSIALNEANVRYFGRRIARN